MSALIEQAKHYVKTAVNTTMVYTYYGVGQYIVEEEQQGEQRAAYGKAIMKELSERLTGRYGKGWSYANLKNIKQFYLVYYNLINSDYQMQGKKGLCQNRRSLFTI